MTSKQSPTSSNLTLYLRLLSYLIPYKLACVGAVLGYAIFATSGVAVAEWLGATLDAINGGDLDYWRVMSPLLCVALVVVRGIGGFMGSFSIAHVANHLVHTLRSQLLSRLLALPVSFFDANTHGNLVSKINYDVTQITGAATNAVALILREGMFVVFLLCYLFWTDWQLSLAFLLVAPVIAKLVSVAAKRFRRYSTQMQNSMGDVTQIATESLKGHQVVRTFNAQDFVANKFRYASNRNRRQNMKMEVTQAVSTPFIQIMVSLAMALLIWLAMSPDFFDDKTPGDFIAFLTAAGLLAKPIRQLSQVNSVIQRGLSAAYSIFSVLDEEAEQDLGTYEAQNVEGRLEFEQVNFAYVQGRPVLHDIQFVAQPGQTIALVGKSGSGKSSLVGLIPRFYQPCSGRITLDGVDINDYKLANLRQNISLVSQQVVLFEGTVKENIAYGMDPDTVDQQQIEQAAICAHAYDFIMDMSDGFETQVGDDAKLLSGGQRQRIAIARALLNDTPILILDEATSALDSESEKHIQEALETLMKGRTTFVIAHRLSTIEKADIILVMANGQIIESGTHRELISQNGKYASLHKIQFADVSQ